MSALYDEILSALATYRCACMRDGPDGDGLPLVDVLSAGAPTISPGMHEVARLADHIYDNLSDCAIASEKSLAASSPSAARAPSSETGAA